MAVIVKLRSLLETGLKARSSAHCTTPMRSGNNYALNYASSAEMIRMVKKLSVSSSEGLGLTSYHNQSKVQTS